MGIPSDAVSLRPEASEEPSSVQPGSCPLPGVPVSWAPACPQPLPVQWNRGGREEMAYGSQFHHVLLPRRVLTDTLGSQLPAPKKVSQSPGGRKVSHPPQVAQPPGGRKGSNRAVSRRGTGP